MDLAKWKIKNDSSFFISVGRVTNLLKLIFKKVFPSITVKSLKNSFETEIKIEFMKVIFKCLSGSMVLL
jgi:hypothetical protein